MKSLDELLKEIETRADILTPEDVLAINKDISCSISRDLERWEAEHLAYFLNQVIKSKMKDFI